MNELTISKKALTKLRVIARRVRQQEVTLTAHSLANDHRESQIAKWKTDDFLRNCTHSITIKDKTNEEAGLYGAEVKLSNRFDFNVGRWFEGKRGGPLIAERVVLVPGDGTVFFFTDFSGTNYAWIVFKNSPEIDASLPSFFSLFIAQFILRGIGVTAGIVPDEKLEETKAVLSDVFRFSSVELGSIDC